MPNRSDIIQAKTLNVNINSPMFIFGLFLLLSTIFFMDNSAYAVDDLPRFCPEINTLEKNNMIWSAPNGWRDYSQSFIDKPISFLGAKWSGANVGKVVCFYGGSDNNFPIVLEHDVIVQEPRDEKLWVKQDNGARFCHMKTTQECPFQPDSKFINQATDPYDFIHKIK